MSRCKIGYARVSTGEQALAFQLDAQRDAGCTGIFRDVGVSGLARHRPGLEKCLAGLRSSDVMVVWKFDRAFRSLKHALDTLEDFEARGIGFCELAHNVDTTSAMGRAFFQMRGAFAELESGLNSERIIAGMEAARQRGVHVGRPCALTPEQIARAHQRVSNGAMSIGAAAKRLGVHPETLARGFRRQGLKRKRQSPEPKGETHG